MTARVSPKKPAKKAAKRKKKAAAAKPVRKKRALRKKATRKRAKRKSQAAYKRKPGSVLPNRKAPAGGGKPRVEIDHEDLRRLSLLGLSQRDIAALLRISRRTLEQRIAEDPDLLAQMELGRAEMRRNIRAAQLQYALVGNATLLIWLGKTECGQRETLRFGAETDDSDDLKPFLQRRLIDFISMRNRDDEKGEGGSDVGNE